MNQSYLVSHMVSIPNGKYHSWKLMTSGHCKLLGIFICNALSIKMNPDWFSESCLHKYPQLWSLIHIFVYKCVTSILNKILVHAQWLVTMLRNWESYKNVLWFVKLQPVRAMKMLDCSECDFTWNKYLTLVRVMWSECNYTHQQGHYRQLLNLSFID